jgi:hypothetical protein
LATAMLLSSRALRRYVRKSPTSSMADPSGGSGSLAGQGAG